MQAPLPASTPAGKSGDASPATPLSDGQNRDVGKSIAMRFVELMRLSTKQNMKIVFTIIALYLQEILFAQEASPAAKLTAAYTQGRADAIKQVNQRYVQQAEVIMKLSMQTSDLGKANATSAWITRLSDANEANDTDGIAPNPSSQDRLVALQTRYLKERAETIGQINKLYAGQVEAAQRQAMQNGDLATANTLSDLLGKVKGASVASSVAVANGVPLFSAEKQKKWKTKKGEWKWEGTKLTGSGDGSIEIEVSLQPPFVAQFKYNPKNGLRAGVIFDHVGLQNAAYADKFGLPGMEDAKRFPYKHGTTYQCTLVVSRKQCELYVDGKLACSGPGKEKKISKITIFSGDGWSPGSVEVQDLIIVHGTDKVPTP